MDLIYDSGRKISNCKVRFEYDESLKMFKEHLFESERVGGLKTTDLVLYDGENTNSTVKFYILGMRKTRKGNGLIVYTTTTLESNGKVIKVFRWVGPVICGSNLSRLFHAEIKKNMKQREKKNNECNAKLSRKTDKLREIGTKS